MRNMPALRTVAGIVLAWYVLFLGASVASAGISGGPFNMVCSAGGEIKWVATGQDEGSTSVHGSMDCPLCAGFVVPPPPAQGNFVEVFRSSAAPPSQATRWHVARLTAPPLPSRGPPAMLFT